MTIMYNVLYFFDVLLRFATYYFNFINILPTLTVLLHCVGRRRRRVNGRETKQSGTSPDTRTNAMTRNGAKSAVLIINNNALFLGDTPPRRQRVVYIGWSRPKIKFCLRSAVSIFFES